MIIFRGKLSIHAWRNMLPDIDCLNKMTFFIKQNVTIVFRFQNDLIISCRNDINATLNHTSRPEKYQHDIFKCIFLKGHFYIYVYICIYAWIGGQIYYSLVVFAYIFGYIFVQKYWMKVAFNVHKELCFNHHKSGRIIRYQMSYITCSSGKYIVHPCHCTGWSLEVLNALNIMNLLFSHEMLRPSIAKFSLQITCLKFLINRTGADELHAPDVNNESCMAEFMKHSMTHITGDLWEPLVLIHPLEPLWILPRQWQFAYNRI